MSYRNINRRQFIQSSLAVGAALTVPSIYSNPVKLTHADLVPLGKTGLKISRIGFGTGSHNGRVQTALGSEGFNKLMHYAYERGIRYIDTSGTYETYSWIKNAIQGLPREKLFIMSKIAGLPENPRQAIDDMRKQLGVDYIDSLLVHCKVHEDWVEKHKSLIDAFEEAKQKKIILSHGVSCHSLPALRVAAEYNWVDVNLVRINPQGKMMDTEKEVVFDRYSENTVDVVLKQIQIMKQNGHGVIGMKLIGNGQFKDPKERKRSIQFVMQKSQVDAAVIGFKSIAEIDEAIENVNAALVG